MRFSHNNRPKRLFVQLLFSVSLIAATCVSSLAQDWHTVHDGMEYAEVTRTIDNQPVKMNLLRLDLKKVRLDVVHAMDAAIGTETVSSMATRHGAVAAINSGFFRLDSSIWAGNPAGLLIIDDEIFSDPSKDRIVLGMTNELSLTTVGIGRSEFVHFFSYGRREIEMSGTNRERALDEIILYTPVFHRTTLTDDTGIEVVVRKNRVTQISSNKGSTLIPGDGYVLSASGSKVEELKRGLRIGQLVKTFLRVRVVRISHEPNPPEMENFEDAVAGVPQLIKDGKIDITWQEEKTTKSFVETRHPRTAVAKLRDGKFLMITVDGRSESSGGISLYDLAAFLLELGATDAMNLDGGGSTTMFLDGKVVNHPSDKEGERKVSDAILVTLRKKN